MLNCGFTQSDLSNLLHTEVDLVKGTITRKRSKTRRKHAKTVPTVTWTLWPQTLELFKKYKSADPKLALTTERGRRLVERGYDDVKGKATSRDSVASNFRHVQKSLKIEKPLKLFRKTGPSELEINGEFGRYAQYFLGLAPNSVAATHYIQPSQDQFDKAVAWLGTKFGFVQEPTIA